jgi:hypothetical protein
MIPLDPVMFIAALQGGWWPPARYDYLPPVEGMTWGGVTGPLGRRWKR